MFRVAASLVVQSLSTKTLQYTGLRGNVVGPREYELDKGESSGKIGIPLPYLPLPHTHTHTNTNWQTGLHNLQEGTRKQKENWRPLGLGFSAGEKMTPGKKARVCAGGGETPKKMDKKNNQDRNKQRQLAECERFWST